MKQYSTDSSGIELQLVSGHLFFADPLYFQDIADNRRMIDMCWIKDKKYLVRQYEEKLFPHGGGCLLGYKFVDNTNGYYSLHPSSLKKWNSEEIGLDQRALQKDITTVGIDSGSFLVIDLANIELLFELLGYDQLIDSLLDMKLDDYFESINKKIGNKGWAYLASEGIGSGIDFDGDGSYVIP